MRLTRILPDTTAADLVQVELGPGRARDSPRRGRARAGRAAARRGGRARLHLPARRAGAGRRPAAAGDGARAQRDRGGPGHRSPARPARGDRARSTRCAPSRSRWPRPTDRSRRLSRSTPRASGGCGCCRREVTVRVEHRGDGRADPDPACRCGCRAISRRSCGRSGRRWKCGCAGRRPGWPASRATACRWWWTGPVRRARDAPRSGCSRPPGLDARALPDSLALVRRSARWLSGSWASRPRATRPRRPCSRAARRERAARGARGALDSLAGRAPDLRRRRARARQPGARAGARIGGRPRPGRRRASASGSSTASR